MAVTTGPFGGQKGDEMEYPKDSGHQAQIDEDGGFWLCDNCGQITAFEFGGAVAAWYACSDECADIIQSADQ